MTLLNYKTTRNTEITKQEGGSIMIFNGLEKEYITVLTELFRPPTPPIEFNERGTKKKFTDMILPVPIKVSSNEHVEHLKQDIAEWLYHEEPKELIFKQIPNLHYLAEYESMELNERGSFGRGTIYFYLKDAHRYSEERIIEATGTRDIKGHISTTWRTRTEFTSNQTGYELQFNSPGKTKLKDINKIVLNGTFRSGDILEIDYRKRRVTLNGKDISNQLVIIESNYMELPIGSVEFEANHKTEVFYHERYY